ncbi:calpain-like cysteine peptidase, partial [Trypanosoma grayi]|uniref:calpain-like cysteine peptidase n=1 Tax=Trypanosoma grayi TaxID=71804 RepID=UPI0004F4521A
TADAAAVEDAKMALLDEAKTLLAADAEAERAAAGVRDALHTRYPMCARDVGEAVEKDAVVAGLVARRAELLQDPEGAGAAIADVEDLLRGRGVEVEALRKRRQRPSRPPCLLAFDDVQLEEGDELDYRVRRQRQRRARKLHMVDVPEEAV